MVEILKKPDTRIWLDWIKISKKFFDENFYNKAKEMVRMYEGDHFPGLPEDMAVVINYCFATVKAILPQIYYQDPYFFITPGDEVTSEENSNAAQSVLNYFWYTMRLKKQIKKIALDALVYGYGIGKEGYFTKTKKITSESGAEHTEKIIEEHPFFIRTSPLDVVTDTNIKNFSDKRWIATRYSLPLYEVKEKYENTGELKGTYLPKNLNEDTIKSMNLKNSTIDSLKLVEFWEILDIVDNKIYVVTDETEKFLRKDDSPYNIKGGNYKFLVFNEVPDKLFPLSDLSQISKINLEIDKTRSQLMNHRSKSQRKIIYETDIFENERAKANFLNEEDLQMVGVKPGRAQTGFYVFNPSMVDANLYNIDALSKDDLNNISAVGYQQRAAESPTEKTATESQIIDRNANLRNSERIDAVTDFCIDVAKDWLSILQDHLTKEVAIKITKEGKERFEKFTKESIKGEHNIRIDIGSMAKPNTGEDRAMVLEFANIALKATDEKGKLIINPEGLIKVLIKKYRFTEDEIKAIMTPKKEEKAQPAKREISPEELARFIEGMGLTGYRPEPQVTGYGMPAAGGY